MQSQSNNSYSPMNNFTLTQMFQNIFSDNSNIMLAAIISLLLVILFVLLLHLYAKWFLAQAHSQAQARRRRRRRRTTVTVSDVLGPARFHHFHSFNIEDSPLSSTQTKGLDSSIISSIPLFIYAEQQEKENEEEEHELECVICLSGFENGEMGRCLPKCGHGFHVECIDMWLSSHSNCPICRAPIVCVLQSQNDSSSSSSSSSVVVIDDDASAFLEIVIDDTQNSEVRGNENDSGRRVIMSDDSDSETSSSLFGCSLKTVFSRIFSSSSDVNQSHGPS